MVGKAQNSHGARSGLYGGCSNGVPPISMSASIAVFSCATLTLYKGCSAILKKGSFNMT
jgi:hypothetical protein